MLLIRTTLAAALFALSNACMAQFTAKDFHAEFIEWVYEPCMNVAAALTVHELDKEYLNAGIKRELLAKVLLNEKEPALQKLVKKANANSRWEDRRQAYPTMLRMCLNTAMSEQ